MGVLCWIAVILIGLNLVFFGTLYIVYLWDEEQKKNEKRGRSRKDY